MGDLAAMIIGSSAMAACSILFIRSRSGKMSRKDFESLRVRVELSKARRRSRSRR